jgi:hypothetical protein
MCPAVTLTNEHGPGKGWQCVCREVNCSHFLRCPVCKRSRYVDEKLGRIANGRPTPEATS